jgi:hypothetical protein
VGYDSGLALLAQLVEHFHGKEGVCGSSPQEGLGKPRKSGPFCLAGRAKCATTLVPVPFGHAWARAEADAPAGGLSGTSLKVGPRGRCASRCRRPSARTSRRTSRTQAIWRAVPSLQRSLGRAGGQVLGGNEQYCGAYGKLQRQ